MMHKRPEKETDPSKLPGQIINRPPSPDTLQHNIKEWERYEKERNEIDPRFPAAHYQDGRDLTNP